MHQLKLLKEAYLVLAIEERVVETVRILPSQENLLMATSIRDTSYVYIQLLGNFNFVALAFTLFPYVSALSIFSS